VLRLIAIVLLLASPYSYADLPPATKCQYLNLQNLPIVFDGVRPTVKGAINGKPVTMLLDTGAYTTFLFMNAAEKLKLIIRDSDESEYGVDGASSVYLVRLKDIEIGPIRASKISLSVKYGPSTYQSFGGLVGADMLLQRDLEISLADELVKFFHPIGCEAAFLAYWDSNASFVEMEPRRDDVTFSPVVTVELNGIKMRAVIDTGAPRSVVNLSAAERVGITVEKPPETKGAGGHASPTWIAPFDSFTIGDESIKNTTIAVMDIWRAAKTHMQDIYGSDGIRDAPDIILGVDFLRSHRVLFASSQHRFYFSYLGGPVFATDIKQEIAWYRKAADKGSADAQVNLGNLYYEGTEVPQDYGLALEWYGKAAEQGEKRAQQSMGHMYFFGKGVSRNFPQSVSWYEKAATQDYAISFAPLGRALFFTGDFSKSAAATRRALEKYPDDPYQQIWMYLAAARAGEDTALNELAEIKKTKRVRKWPVPLMEFFLGSIQSDVVFKSAEDRDAKTSNEQTCEANFYVAEWHLLHGRQKDAESLLATAVSGCPKNFIEYDGAIAELERLGVK